MIYIRGGRGGGGEEKRREERGDDDDDERERERCLTLLFLSTCPVHYTLFSLEVAYI